ncbi:MAG: hypothetical protein AAFX05_09510 [Planctomycetota bacterium]
MTRRLGFAAALVVLTGGVASAQVTETITFGEVGNGFIINGETIQNVTFDTFVSGTPGFDTDTDLLVETVGFPALPGSNWSGQVLYLGNDITPTADVVNTFDFTVPVSSMEFQFANIAPTTFASIDVTAYDASNSVLFSQTFHPSAGPIVGQGTVSISGVGAIARVEAISQNQPGFGNSSFIDDLTYTTIPAPGVAGILGVSGLAMGLGRRRR